jgi:hypothetical protein
MASAKGKKPKAAKTRGRPSKYDPALLTQVTNYCLLGATDEQLAVFIGIDVRTLARWKEDYPEFCQAIKEGKEVADATIGQSLFHRARGYSHPEVKIFNNNGEAMVVDCMKHYPPDTTACIFWLKNRQKEKWRDKHEVDHGITSDLASLLMAQDGNSSSLISGD